MKKLIWILLAIIVLGAVGYIYVFHKPQRDLVGESAAHTLKADELFVAFTKDQDAANVLYVDQIVEVQGSVTELGENFIQLDNTIYCAMDSTAIEAINTLNTGQTATVKGRVLSYDDLFEEVKLDNCVLP